MTTDEGATAVADPPQTDATEQPVDEQKEAKIHDAMQKICGDIIAQTLVVKAARDEYDDSSEETKKLKKELESEQMHLESLCNRLRDASNGNLQPELFDKNGDAVKSEASEPTLFDPAETAPISELGMTAKETEILEEHEIETVADLEKAMRENEWWHKDIKGFGPTKVDKLSDKLLAWRKDNPVKAADEPATESATNDADLPADAT